MSRRADSTPLRLLLAFAAIYGLLYAAWLPLRGVSTSALAMVTERVIWFMERPSLLTRLRADGDSVVVHSYVQGLDRPLVVWSARNLHLFIILPLALVLAVESRCLVRRWRVVGATAALVATVALLITLMQVESVADAEARRLFGLALIDDRGRGLLDAASRGLIAVGMLFVPAVVFLASFMSGLGPARPDAREERRHAPLRVPMTVGAGAAVLVAATLLARASPPGPRDYPAGLSKLQALNPASARPACSRGVAFEEQGDLPAADAAYREALQVDPRLAAAHYGLGNVLFKQRDLPGAEAAYREAIRLDPAHASALQNLGILLLERGADDEAARFFAEVIRIDSSHASAHNNLGLALTRLGRSCEALPHLRAAVRLDRRYAGDVSMKVEIARRETDCRKRSE